ncbi:DUF7345 domain-containing protein [Natrinema salaciae]|uniref:DUF7345 domain-containing protein n=1 Tax=Natrinema salaciae TaxID=1186196 RepID=A0A1H9FN52_9EURY|nr:DUF4897 domain-containing protein [Natrinema salaciae]SEQ39367.1 protein of unknown function [Natrinema salaciae]
MTDDEIQRRPRRRRVRVAYVLVAIALLVTAPVAAATEARAATSQMSDPVPAEPAFVVELDVNGSAQVALTVTFDLTTDSERQAFQSLRANATAHERRTEQFAARMRAIASGAANDTGRAMQVRGAAISFTEREDTGIVTLSVTWDGLAARTGDRLVVREPFDSEFATDRTVRITGPDGYELTTVTPEPTDRTRTAATWNGGTAFEGFEATFEPDETAADGTSIPGFGAGIAVLAVLVGAALLAYRGHNRR